jgi:hypothetical protein
VVSCRTLVIFVLVENVVPVTPAGARSSSVVSSRIVNDETVVMYRSRKGTGKPISPTSIVKQVSSDAFMFSARRPLFAAKIAVDVEWSAPFFITSETTSKDLKRDCPGLSDLFENLRQVDSAELPNRIGAGRQDCGDRIVSLCRLS